MGSQAFSIPTTTAEIRRFQSTNPLRVPNASEQVAAHLRGEIGKRTWNGLVAGGNRLAKELGIGRNTIDAALQQLEKEGLLEPPVSHIDWTFNTVTRTMTRWLNHLAAGKGDRKQSFIKATFAEGGTIGKAAGS